MAIGRLWNFGAKVKQLDADVDFFTALGGKVRLRETLHRGDQSIQYALLDWGGTRLYLTPEPVFERELPRELATGLTHVVVEVDSVAEAVETAVRAGGVVRIPPDIVEGGFGSREIAFVESPGEVIIEFIRIISDAVGQ
jgi:catechol 2,3-dioxygenase-like lactoylglutathione lyase family enzyme